MSGLTFNRVPKLAMRALIRADGLAARHYRVVLTVVDLSYGWGRETTDVWAWHKTVAEMTGLSPRRAGEALRECVAMGLLTEVSRPATRRSRVPIEYAFQTDHRRWRTRKAVPMLPVDWVPKWAAGGDESALVDDDETVHQDSTDPWNPEEWADELQEIAAGINVSCGPYHSWKDDADHDCACTCEDDDDGNCACGTCRCHVWVDHCNPRHEADVWSQEMYSFGCADGEADGGFHQDSRLTIARVIAEVERFIKVTARSQYQHWWDAVVDPAARKHRGAFTDEWLVGLPCPGGKSVAEWYRAEVLADLEANAGRFKTRGRGRKARPDVPATDGPGMDPSILSNACTTDPTQVAPAPAGDPGTDKAARASRRGDRSTQDEAKPVSLADAIRAVGDSEADMDYAAEDAAMEQEERLARMDTDIPMRPPAGDAQGRQKYARVTDDNADSQRSLF